MDRTKIVATIGPASNKYPVLRKMMLQGLDVVRLNFSHGSHKEHLVNIELVRTLNKKYRRHMRIMQDLEGFRIRVGRFKGDKERELKRKSTVFLVTKEETQEASEIPFDYDGDLSKIEVGQFIFIDDGNLILKVKQSAKKYIRTEVVEGGILKERKGINIPEANIPFTGITEKDKDDIAFGIANGMDYVAQSFVRRRQDVEDVKKLIKPYLPGCKIVAKIESRDAIKNIDDIIDAADGIMVARGDMGIAVPICEIPVIQKLIIKKCNKKKKFVITATQMLEHMTEHSRPTRAEATDVANAILDGTDFVMLSAESASGKYPVEAVAMMNQIIGFTEAYKYKRCKSKFLKNCV